MKKFIKIIEIFRYHIQISMQNIIFGHTLPLKQNQLAFFLGGGGGVYLLGYSIAGHFHFDVDFLRLGV